MTLVHVGWPKTASTWLQRELFVAPQGFVQPWRRTEVIRRLVLPDQLAFDADGLRAQVTADAERAAEQGLVPVISHERLCGVLTHRFESVVLGERILDAVPDARLLVVVREQRDAMLSAWQQYVRNGSDPSSGPHVRRLEDFFGDEPTRASALRPLGELHYFEYDRLVRWYADRVGHDRLLVLPLEMLRRDPADFVQRIRDLCGVDVRTMPQLDASNEAWAPMTYGLKRRLNLVGDRRSARRTGRSPHDVVMAASYRFDRALPGRVRRWGLDDARAHVDSLARGHFEESNARLADLVDWSPADHGYLVPDGGGR